MRLIEVLQDDGDVHVDDDHVADDDEGGEVGDGEEGAAAVAVVAVVAELTLWRLDHKGLQHIVPAG